MKAHDVAGKPQRHAIMNIVERAQRIVRAILDCIQIAK